MPRRRKSTKKKTTSSASSRSRASWRGMIRFGLVTFPAEAVNAHAVDKDHIVLHQLHAKCHSRIRYQKTCPIHGPVDNDEIVSGYEVSKGKYVEIDEGELDALRTEEEKALTIDTFVAPDRIDPFYYDGRVYFLAPDGSSAREPYALFLEALRRQERYGVGKVVFSGKEQVVLVRPYDDVLLMVLLNYAAEMRDPTQVAPAASVRHGDKQLKLAEQLIASWSDANFDFAAYEDTYYEKLEKLIDAKAHGKEVVAPEVEEEPDVINLTDALRKSLERSSRRNGAERKGTLHRKPRAPTPRRRKRA